MAPIAQPRESPREEQGHKLDGELSGASSGAPQSPSGISGFNATSSLLRRYSDDELHDIVCVGFGPAALAIAVALHDELENKTPKLRTKSPKVRFIEHHQEYAWHPGMLLENSNMQISFIKDLATLRNPRSKFTFTNYLHDQERLVDFINLATLLPKRLEYNEYMRWCASAFDDVVDYGRSVTKVQAVDGASAVQSFRVISTCRQTSMVTEIQTKHVIIAVGGRPYIPESLKLSHPRIIHSSQYVTSAEGLFQNSPAPKRIAVVGAGQSAAEIFYDVHSRFPGAQSVLITRGSALRPSDDSPFVNEIFNPSRTDDVFYQHKLIRARAMAADRATNYGVVRLSLLEEIYSTLYSYKVKHLPEETWPHRILNHSTPVSVVPAKAQDRSILKLGLENSSPASCGKGSRRDQEVEVDMVIVACGYRRNVHEELMQDLQTLRAEEDEAWSVGRDYAVRFKDGAVQSGRGIWLQGCNEQTHGLPDSLLSVLAVRAGEVVDSILGTRGAEKGREEGEVEEVEEMEELAAA